MKDLTHITSNTGHVCTVKRTRYRKGVSQTTRHIIQDGRGLFIGPSRIRVLLRHALGAGRLFSLSLEGAHDPLVLAAVCWGTSETAWSRLEDAYVELTQKASCWRALHAPETLPWLAVHLLPAFYRADVPCESAAFLADVEQWVAWGLLDARES